MSNYRELGRKTNGDRAEFLVARMLERQGYEILEQKLRVGRLEIDLVISRPRLLAFVEVRSRSADWGIHPSETIDRKKIRHIRMAASIWLAGGGGAKKASTIRFDAASVVFRRGEHQIDYVEDAF